MRDQIEQYNSTCIFWDFINTYIDESIGKLVNRNVTKRQHPEALRPFLPEISAFAKFCHFNILFPILRYDSLLQHCIY